MPMRLSLIRLFYQSFCFVSMIMAKSSANTSVLMSKLSQHLPNRSTLVGKENGVVMVPTYDWVTFLKPHFKKVVGIKSHHHFDFCDDNLGVVAMREFADSSPTVQMLSTSSCPVSLPSPLLPRGLDAKRKVYLFKEIREFCKEECKDVVCPEPAYPEQMDTSSAASDSNSDNEVPAGISVGQDMPVSHKEPATTSKTTGTRGRVRGRGRGRSRMTKPQRQKSDDDTVLPTTSSAAQAEPDSSDSDYEPRERARQRGRGSGCGRRQSLGGCLLHS